MLETLCGILLKGASIVIKKQFVSSLDVFLGIKYDPDSSLVTETHSFYVQKFLSLSALIVYA